MTAHIMKIALSTWLGFALALTTLTASVNAAPTGSANDESSPQRIIALSPHSVELLFLLGVGDRIVATTEFADYPQAAKDIQRIGSHSGIQIERVIELEPDLVVAWKSGNPEQDITRIRELGYRVYSSETRVLLDIAREMETLGALVGKADKGRELSAQFREELEALKAQYSDRRPISFFYQLWNEPLRAMAAGSWINTVFEGCGARNILSDRAQDYPQVSIEHVVLAQPEVIVIPTHHGKAMNAEIWKPWPEVPAVKNKRIRFFNGDLLHRFSFRILEGMKQVCEAFDEIRIQQNTPDKIREK